MELAKRILNIIDTNIILCLIPMILCLLLVHLFFKNRFQTKKALNVISWIILIYTIVMIIYSIIGIIFYYNEFAFINRATGPYKLFFWFMFLSANVFPFTLFIKKFRTKFLYVLAVAFFMKIGAYFERFVIITTSLHRDYAEGHEFSDLFFLLSILMLQGFLLAIILLGILEIVERKNHKKLN